MPVHHLIPDQVQVDRVSVYGQVVDIPLLGVTRGDALSWGRTRAWDTGEHLRRGVARRGDGRGWESGHRIDALHFTQQSRLGRHGHAGRQTRNIETQRRQGAGHFHDVAQRIDGDAEGRRLLLD